MFALPEQESGGFSLGIQSDQAPTKPLPRAVQQAGFTVEWTPMHMSGGISMQINAEYEGLKKGEINLFHNTWHFFSLPCTLFFKSCTQLMEGIQLPQCNGTALQKAEHTHLRPWISWGCQQLYWQYFWAASEKSASLSGATLTRKNLISNQSPIFPKLIASWGVRGSKGLVSAFVRIWMHFLTELNFSVCF